MARTMTGTEEGQTYRRGDNEGDVSVTLPAETRRSLATTEFWVMLGAVAAVLIFGYSSDTDNLDVARTWLYVTILASAYMTSRGMAKAGSTGLVRRKNY